MAKSQHHKPKTCSVYMRTAFREEVLEFLKSAPGPKIKLSAFVEYCVTQEMQRIAKRRVNGA